MTTQHMARALNLAAQAGQEVHPNPRVGAILVLDDQIIGEGFHRGPGSPHAEEAAIQDALTRGTSSADLSRSQLICTLEPCSRMYPGKHRHPCTDLIIEHRIGQVRIAMLDPNPMVRGQGVAKLRQAGLLVQVGDGAAQAVALNADFVARMLGPESQGAPSEPGFPAVEHSVMDFNQIPIPEGVTLKLATTLDGQIGRQLDEPMEITSPEARQWSRQLRSRFDAVIFGIGTVLADNPRYLSLETSHTTTLNQSEAGPIASDPGRSGQPLRVLLDSRLSLADSAGNLQLTGTLARGPVLIFCAALANQEMKSRAALLQSLGYQIQPLEAGQWNPQEGMDPRVVVERLFSGGFKRLLLETGPRLSAAFLSLGLVREILWFREPVILGRGINAAEYLLTRPGTTPGSASNQGLGFVFHHYLRIGTSDLTVLKNPGLWSQAGREQEVAHVYRAY